MKLLLSIITPRTFSDLFMKLFSKSLVKIPTTITSQELRVTSFVACMVPRPSCSGQLRPGLHVQYYIVNEYIRFLLPVFLSVRYGCI